MIERKVQLDSNKSNYDVVVRTISGKPLGQIPSNAIKSIKREVGKPSEIVIQVPRFYMNWLDFETKTYPLFNEIYNERQISLDNNEIYSIKSIERSNDETLTITGKSREIRLTEIDIDIEDCGFTFFRKDGLDIALNNKLDVLDTIDKKIILEESKRTPSFKAIMELKMERVKVETELSKIEKDIEIINKKNDIYDINSDVLSLNEYLYQETGWRVGTVSDKVRFDKDTKEQALRWQEKATKKWYDFITKDLCDSFDCMVDFDSYDKKVHFFKEDELGDDIGLYLSKDNYIKNMTRIFDSDKIVTRLKVIGNEDMDIIGSICTGYNYIENYSYFMKNREMSDELITALEKYYEMVELREKQWKKYVDRKQECLKSKKVLGTTFIDAEAQIYALNQIYDTYHTPPNENADRASQVLANITKLQDKSTDAKNKIEILDKEIMDLDKSIDNVVSLCRKPTATDENGKLIFNRQLLAELKEYIYTETYNNDSYLTENVDELIELAKRKLREKCKPTFKWELDVVNFLERLEPVNRLSWSGTISLGDLVILYDREDDSEEFIYITGYKHNVQEHELEITLSNKKTNVTDGLTIADYLTKAKNAMRDIELERYLFIQQKYNRLNLPKEYIAKYNEKKKPRPDGVIID